MTEEIPMDVVKDVAVSMLEAHRPELATHIRSVDVEQKGSYLNWTGTIWFNEPCVLAATTFDLDFYENGEEDYDFHIHNSLPVYRNKRLVG